MGGLYFTTMSTRVAGKETQRTIIPSFEIERIDKPFRPAKQFTEFHDWVPFKNRMYEGFFHFFEKCSHELKISLLTFEKFSTDVCENI